MLLVIIFLLSVFMLAQFFLSREVTGKDTALAKLNQQIQELTSLLAMERSAKNADDGKIAYLAASLVAGAEGRERLRNDADGRRRRRRRGDRQGQRRCRTRSTRKRQITARALAQVDILNQQISALRKQLAAIQDALDASQTSDRESQAKIADLGQRLNVALAQKVQELSRYRSDFFGRLRQILGARPDIRVVGDRFVFESSVLFESGKADVTAAGHAVARQPRERRAQSGARNSARHSLDPAHRRPYRRQADQQPDRSNRTGTFRPRARSRSCNILCQRASIRTISPPPASASFSRSTTAPTTMRWRATAASS